MAGWIAHCRRRPVFNRRQGRAKHVQRGTLIDGVGEFWREGDLALARRLGIRDPGQACAARAVQDFGCVLLRAHGRSVHVTLNPSLVARAALAALYYRIFEIAPERVLLSYLERRWRHELLRGAEEALLRLEDLGIAADAGAPPSPYRVHRLRLALRRHSALERFAPLLALWHAGGGRAPEPITDALAAFNLLDRAVVLRVPAKSGRLLFAHRGAGFSFYRPCWGLLAVGRDFEDQPDRGYAERTAADYRAVLADGEPRFEAVDAVIRTPGRDTRRNRYDRLLLRWQNAGGEFLLTGVSQLRASHILERA